MVNLVHLLGRLGNKPELRYTTNGTPVATFTLATSERYQDKAGNKKENIEWHRCVVWGKDGELLANHMDKGQLLWCEGKIQTKEYENKQGQKVRVTEIKVHSFDWTLNKKSDAVYEQELR